MATLSGTLKFVLAKRVSQVTSACCARTFVVSGTLHKPTNGNNKVNGGSGLNIPKNVEEIQDAEKAKFSPHRARDSSSARLEMRSLHPCGSFSKEFMGSQGSKGSTLAPNEKLNTKSFPNDSHVDVYDVSRSVSLSSVMQSTVPHPYNISGKKAPVHLNMPGGQWAQDDKYVSGDLQDHHSRNIARKFQVE